MQLSEYTIKLQCEAIASQLIVDGSMRLYEGAEPPIKQRTEGRLVSCPITSVTIDGATLTIKWDAGTAIKSGQADYFRLCSKNIPVLSGSVPEEMSMSDRKLLAATETNAATVIDAGMLLHTVFNNTAKE